MTKRYNHMLDVAFTIESIAADWTDIPVIKLIDALQQRVAYLQANPDDAAEAFGYSDSYEVEPADPQPDTIPGRVARVQAMLETYQLETYQLITGEAPEVFDCEPDLLPSDMLTDLMHWFDSKDLSFDIAVHRARDHHQCEVAEANDE